MLSLCRVFRCRHNGRAPGYANIHLLLKVFLNSPVRHCEQKLLSPFVHRIAGRIPSKVADEPYDGEPPLSSAVEILFVEGERRDLQLLGSGRRSKGLGDAMEHRLEMYEMYEIFGKYFISLSYTIVSSVSFYYYPAPPPPPSSRGVGSSKKEVHSVMSIVNIIIILVCVMGGGAHEKLNI